jgi:sugar phosphate isomerase/epimerase
LREEENFEGYELELDCFAFLDRNWNILHKTLERFEKERHPILAVHGILSSKSVKTKYLSFRVDEEDEKIAVKALKNQIVLAKKLCTKGKPILILHSAEITNPTEEKMKRSADLIIRNFRLVKEFLKKQGVYIALENTYDAHDYQDVCSKADSLKEIIKKVNSPFVKINMDWGHLNAQASLEYLAGNILKKELISFNYHKEFIRKLRGDIVYVHLHYNDCHLLKKVKGSKKKRLDQHRPLLHFAKNDFEVFMNIINDMTRENDIEKICLEMLPSHVLKFIRYFPYGGQKKEILESVKLFRNSLKD